MRLGLCLPCSSVMDSNYMAHILFTIGQYPQNDLKNPYIRGVSIRVLTFFGAGPKVQCTLNFGAYQIIIITFQFSFLDYHTLFECLVLSWCFVLRTTMELSLELYCALILKCLTHMKIHQILLFVNLIVCYNLINQINFNPAVPKNIPNRDLKTEVRTKSWR